MQQAWQTYDQFRTRQWIPFLCPSLADISIMINSTQLQACKMFAVVFIPLQNIIDRSEEIASKSRLAHSAGFTSNVRHLHPRHRRMRPIYWLKTATKATSQSQQTNWLSGPDSSRRQCTPKIHSIPNSSFSYGHYYIYPPTLRETSAKTVRR